MIEKEVVIGIVIGTVFICLIILFCAILIKLYIHKVKTYTKVIYQKDLDFQKTLNTTIVETQEQVLNNISQDLHDDAGQQLTYINFQLENLKLDSPDLANVLAPVSESISSLSSSIRRISHALNNQLIAQQDLIKAITSEADRLQQTGKLNVILTVGETQPNALGKNEQIVVYRIFQEIINNILKHSGADTIKIDIDTMPEFRMDISDNGRGFDTNQGNTATLGLQSMSHRAQLIGYTVSVTSEKGKGTLVSVSQSSI
ncbi:MAG TPA: ATP-binding protein [Flavobacterium sp.]|jgi:signal transduction histidine kinase